MSSQRAHRRTKLQSFRAERIALRFLTSLRALRRVKVRTSRVNGGLLLSWFWSAKKNSESMGNVSIEVRSTHTQRLELAFVRQSKRPKVRKKSAQASRPVKQRFQLTFVRLVELVVLVCVVLEGVLVFGLVVGIGFDVVATNVVLTGTSWIPPRSSPLS